MRSYCFTTLEIHAHQRHVYYLAYSNMQQQIHAHHRLLYYLAYRQQFTRLARYSDPHCLLHLFYF